MLLAVALRGVRGRQRLHPAQVDYQVGVGLASAGGRVCGLVACGNGLSVAFVGGAPGAGQVIVGPGGLSGDRQHQRQCGGQGVSVQLPQHGPVGGARVRQDVCASLSPAGEW